MVNAERNKKLSFLFIRLKINKLILFKFIYLKNFDETKIKSLNSTKRKLTILFYLLARIFTILTRIFTSSFSLKIPATGYC